MSEVKGSAPSKLSGSQTAILNMFELTDSDPATVLSALIDSAPTNCLHGLTDRAPTNCLVSQTELLQIVWFH